MSLYSCCIGWYAPGYYIPRSVICELYCLPCTAHTLGKYIRRSVVCDCNAYPVQEVSYAEKKGLELHDSIAKVLHPEVINLTMALLIPLCLVDPLVSC